MGHIKKSRIASLNPAEWAGRMSGIPCFILGNAPSINDMELSLLNDYLTIGINRIFYKYDPTILIWQDLALWIQEQKRILQTESIKYCREGSETKGGFYTFKLHGRETKLTAVPTQLYGRGSSGSISYQLAWALKCNPIILVGMDCSYGKVDGKVVTDFYGDNSMHRKHTLPDCVKGLKFIRDNHSRRIIYNCSFTKVFPERLTIKEVIEKLPKKKYTRKELEGILLEGLKSD